MVASQDTLRKLAIEVLCTIGQSPSARMNLAALLFSPHRSLTVAALTSIEAATVRERWQLPMTFYVDKQE